MADKKHVYESKTERVELLMPPHINGSGRLFGGKLMEWIDITAAVTARRHSECNVTTASVDKLDFLSPAFEDDTLVLKGKITYVGRTSMEVKVNTFIEKLSGERKKINTAYLTMVALDKNGNPTEVPGLICDTKKEQEEFEASEKRRMLRKERKVKGF